MKVKNSIRLTLYLLTMATLQDYWNGDHQQAIKEANQWFLSLRVGDELLHPPFGTGLIGCDPSGKDFQIVRITKLLHNDEVQPHVVIHFPGRDHGWNKKLLLKYAFAG